MATRRQGIWQDVLGARPFRGRVLRPEDALMGGTGEVPPATSVVLSYGLWQQWFGGRDDAIGRTMTINSAAVSIVGVMPREFSVPDAEALAWTPMSVGAAVVPGGGRPAAPLTRPWRGSTRWS